MKNLIAILLIFVSLELFSQVEVRAQDSLLYLTSEEEAFMIDKETKSLFKISPGIGSIQNDLRSNSLGLEFEQKLGKSFSIIPRASLFIYNGGADGYSLGGAVRYYNKMAKLIKENKQANNLSSTYFEASFGLTESFSQNLSIAPAYSYKVSYGSQKRFMNYGFIDFSIGLSYFKRGTLFSNGTNELVNVNRHTFFLSNDTNFGIGFGKNYKLEDDLKCPVFRCFENRKSAFKINLKTLNFLGYSFWGEGPLNISDTGLFISFRPNIIHEQKLGNSSFSFEQEIDAYLYFNKRPFEAFGLNNYFIEYKAGIKHYFNLKNKINRGESGNNLSGHYGLVNGSIGFNRYQEFVNQGDGTFQIVDVDYRRVNAQMFYGYQREFLDKYFFDFKIGFSKNIKTWNFNSTLDGLQLLSDFKIGLMF